MPFPKVFPSEKELKCIERRLDYQSTVSHINTIINKQRERVQTLEATIQEKYPSHLIRDAINGSRLCRTTNTTAELNQNDIFNLLKEWKTNYVEKGELSEDTLLELDDDARELAFLLESGAYFFFIRDYVTLYFKVYVFDTIHLITRINQLKELIHDIKKDFYNCLDDSFMRIDREYDILDEATFFYDYNLIEEHKETVRTLTDTVVKALPTCDPYQPRWLIRHGQHRKYHQKIDIQTIPACFTAS